MGSDGFFASYVIDICFGDAKPAIFGFEAADASAALFDGGEVVRHGSVAQVDSSLGGDCISETLYSDYG